MEIFNKLGIIKNEIFRPMPLESNFKDYDEYWDHRGFHGPSLSKAKIISKHLKEGASVMDIGCGDGTMIDYLSKNNKARAVGIDISQMAVDFTRQKGHEAYRYNVLEGEFKEYLKGKKFDYIIITEVLEHIQDPEELMLAIKGHFNESIFVSIPNSGFFINRVRLLFGKFPLVLIQQHVKEHIRFWTLADFKYWTSFLGLRLAQYIPSAGLNFKPLGFLERWWPSLFASQILYEIKIK
jgi:methionine biosynthesis protein MetW